MIQLLKLRLLVTFRSYTRTVTSRVESFFFFPLFFLAMINIYIFLPFFLWQAYIFPAPPVMIFNVFFLFLTIMWISVPLMGFRLNESLDLKKLLHFPISFQTIYFSGLIGNFLDISSLVPITFLAALLNFFSWNGDVSTLPPAILVCVVFFVFLQLMHQLAILFLYYVLPRINPMKILAIILVFIVGFVIGINLNLFTVPEEFSIFNDENLKYHVYLPTGYFGIALYEFWIGNFSLGYEFLLKCLLWLIPLLIINAILTFLTYQGTELGLVRSGSSKRKVVRTYKNLDGMWGRISSHPVIVIFLMEAKVLLRDWHFIFYKMMPGIVTPTLIILIIKYHFTQYDVHINDSFFKYLALGFIVLVIMLFLAQAFIFVGNIFGYDREAITMLFTAPIDEKRLLLGKNIFMFLLLSVDAFVISSLTYIFFPRIYIQLSFFCFMECMIMILVGLGNFSSIIYPYHVPFDKPNVSFQGTLIVAILSMATDLLLLTLVAPIGIGFFFILTQKKFFLLAPAITISIFYSVALYWLFLYLSSKLMPRYRESIFQNVRIP